jgi:hypothetical protein
MSAVSSSYLHPRVEPAPNPHITGFRCGFHFSPVGAPETPKKSKKTSKSEKILKVTEKTLKVTEKTLKVTEKPETRKDPDRNREKS